MRSAADGGAGCAGGATEGFGVALGFLLFPFVFPPPPAGGTARVPAGGTAPGPVAPGTVRAAAAAVHLTQPAVSKRIAALERYYAQLCDRPAYREHVMVSYDSLRAE